VLQYGLNRFPTARVQRGESATARCASTGDRSGRPPRPSGISSLPSGILPHSPPIFPITNPITFTYATNCLCSLIHIFLLFEPGTIPADIPLYNGDAPLHPLDRRQPRRMRTLPPRTRPNRPRCHPLYRARRRGGTAFFTRPSQLPSQQVLPIPF